VTELHSLEVCVHEGTDDRAEKAGRRRTPRARKEANPIPVKKKWVRARRAPDAGWIRVYARRAPIATCDRWMRARSPLAHVSTSRTRKNTWQSRTWTRRGGVGRKQKQRIVFLSWRWSARKWSGLDCLWSSGLKAASAGSDGPELSSGPVSLRLKWNTPSSNYTAHKFNKIYVFYD
jgi:hypothetical protein